MTRAARPPLVQQPFLPEFCPLAAAVKSLSDSGTEARGAIFTRPEVVDFILDLVGYTSDRPLHRLRLLEPSFGGGDFLLAVVARLLKSWQAENHPKPADSLTDCLRAVELHRDSFQATRKQVLQFLSEHGVSDSDARTLAGSWLTHGDFLLTPLDGSFDFVVGNPPYVRQEMIPDALLAEYRARYATLYDRADIYIPFIERSLRCLSDGGQLGFICADRWMKNKYGGPLRRLVAADYHLKVYVDMVDTPAFQSDVIAYPAITVITRERGRSTRIARRPEINAGALKALAHTLRAESLKTAGAVTEVVAVANDAQPWILDSAGRLAVVRRLEAEFPGIEEAGCNVGIGVATGADKSFIGPFDELDVEEDRKLPLVMTRDILNGVVEWRGLGVINPFADDGGLVDLASYPRLRNYLEARKDAVAGRHVAKKAPASWYRTIDRIYPALARRPKLLIPDIKGEAHIVFEDGKLYPHHNLYFITSDRWDLRALQAVLLSGIARLFVATYSTKMRGGYLRFQAQYLRRIRLPRWDGINPGLRQQLVRAAEARDLGACNSAAIAIYGLSEQECAAIGGNGEDQWPLTSSTMTGKPERP